MSLSFLQWRVKALSLILWPEGAPTSLGGLLLPGVTPRRSISLCILLCFLPPPFLVFYVTCGGGGGEAEAWLGNSPLRNTYSEHLPSHH